MKISKKIKQRMDAIKSQRDSLRGIADPIDFKWHVVGYPTDPEVREPTSHETYDKARQTARQNAEETGHIYIVHYGKNDGDMEKWIRVSDHMNPSVPDPDEYYVDHWNLPD